MGIGLTEEHLALAASVRGLAERTVEHAALAAQGVLGLHLPEECGGQGYGLLELVVALEALGERRAPGAYLPSVITSAALARASGGDPGALGGLADGSLTAAVALGEAAGGAGLLALGSPDADLFLVPLEDGRWSLLDRADVDVESVEGVDLDRALCSVTVRDGTAREGGDGRVLGAVPVREVAAVLLGADACGVAAWAVATAAGYAKVREQFGRPIGQFQGVKHRVAAALVALEQARAAVWDAARALDDSPGRTPTGESPDPTATGESPGRSPMRESPGTGAGSGGEVRLAVGVAAVLAPDAAVRCAADAIQVLGGIGYTFEHEAHRFYRRALSDRMLAGDAGVWAEEVIRLALAGVRRGTEPDLPEEAAPVRDAIRAQAESLRAEEPLARLGRFAREGWIMPYLPEPWGRGASPLEQVIIHQEFRDLRRPNLGIGAWAVPSIVRHGTPEQRERFLPRTFTGEIVWCQLFSEPGAGSDLAGLSTKAVRVEGGWSLSGQKIWTSLAQYAHWGICLARTSPEKPKHEGISYFLVDMSSPGVTVKPLKEINGDEVFNEVFLDDVFVPDDLVVGEVDGGWRVARDTLSHERVALGDSWGPGSRHTDMVGLIAKLPEPRQARLEEAGRLWAEGQALAALGLRVTLAQLSGSDPGTASSVRKLLGMRHSQAVSEFCWSLAPFDRHWSRMILTTRAFTIGGGTTEVQLNIIAERALGLPRDP
ncbi:acyl-CoA dehydrogenase [Nonomuraea cavernae]|uniref:Acyl-CoA dehydrogenase FadE n=1 Tax=Nonomuraea cavernae TaxID=2045107 RepID=A0A917Z7P9_9ACTN|nr:acyl-CoA dehydrogenase [Nonomuraea cavernae]MCA2186967.1 acyl-CoA dehydrogenase [Nonomuraea cavernae]GGO75155.1 putative acyl-CoA dehydrogenase FadE [Nonomuraea cavernae]